MKVTSVAGQKPPSQDIPTAPTGNRLGRPHEDLFRNAGAYDGHVADNWTFLSNHGHVLVSLAMDPEARLRDVAEQVGITERAVQQIVGDLESAGYVSKAKVGRRNTYTVDRSGRFRHDLEQHVEIGDFLALLQRTHA